MSSVCHIGKLLSLSALLLVFFLSTTANAQIDQEVIGDLKNSINDRTSKIRTLEKEIEKFEEELIFVGKEKNSLQGAIRSLDLSQGKIEAEQGITKNRISATIN